MPLCSCSLVVEESVADCFQVVLPHRLQHGVERVVHTNAGGFALDYYAAETLLLTGERCVVVLCEDILDERLVLVATVDPELGAVVELVGGGGKQLAGQLLATVAFEVGDGLLD